MSLEKKFARGGVAIAVTQVASQFCALGRNIIIARLISPANFGIASIFLMTISFLEMISNLSLDRLLVQSPDGDNEIFQRVAHFLQAMRGFLSCLIILVLAWPVSTLFSIPEAKGSFYALALIPLFNGFIHLDLRRIERDLRFWPNASVEIISHFTAFALAWPIGKWLGDYRAILYLLIARSMILMVGTHILADRKYEWSRNREYTKRFFTFGWPILIDGLLLFGILQGDRFILGSAKKIFDSTYNMSDVGLYSAAFMLAMMPAFMCLGVCSKLFLPILSREQDSTSAFNSKVRLFSQGLTIVTLAIGTVMLLTGDKLLPLIYGKQYAVAGSLVSWLSIMWVIRILRVLPVTITMAKGNTKNLMYANIVRAVFLVGIVLIVYYKLNIIWIAIVGVIGELCAYWYSLFLNKHHFKIPISLFIRSDVFLVAGLTMVALLKITVLDNITGPLWFVWGTLIILTLPSLVTLFLPEIRQKLTSLIYKTYFNTVVP
ncbi:MAG: oligosaccharide flippase family protein [Chlorobium sp.]|nr:oligosaccharide flippase family protein [Chlorobium sp.]